MSASIISNRISKVIAPEKLAAAAAAVQTLWDCLGDDLVSLGTEDRRSMPRMGDKNEVFAAKTLEYAIAHPEFLPPYVDVAEFQKDVDLVEALRPLLRSLTPFTDVLKDTVDLAGSEAVMASLPYYTTVKGAAKHGVLKAVAIADDLSRRFAGQGRSKKPVVTGEPPAGEE